MYNEFSLQTIFADLKKRIQIYKQFNYRICLVWLKNICKADLSDSNGSGVPAGLFNMKVNSVFI